MENHDAAGIADRFHKIKQIMSSRNKDPSGVEALEVYWMAATDSVNITKYPIKLIESAGIDAMVAIFNVIDASAVENVADLFQIYIC